MVDCPCGYGKNIKENQKACPVCGMDLTPLHYLKSIPGIYYKKGKELAEQGKLDEAVKQLTTSIVLNYNNAAPYIELGHVYIRKKLYNEAIAQFDKALEIDPSNKEAKGAISEAKKIKNIVEEDKLRQTHKITVFKRLLIITPLVTFMIGLIIFPIYQNIIKPKQLEETPISEGNVSSGEFVVEEIKPKEELTLSEIADNIKKEIVAYNVLANLDIKVSFSEKELYISGEVPTEIHKNLIVEIARNVAGKNKVDIKNLKVTPIPEKEPEWLYEVKPSDTLTQIAYNFYGDSKMWYKIYESNKEKIDNPDKIYIGQILKIPAK